MIHMEVAPGVTDKGR